MNTSAKNDSNTNKEKLEKSKTFVKKDKDNIKDKLQPKKIWIYFCRCFFKCNKNNNTFLLNKAMKLIQEKMDIIKIIQKLLKEDNNKKKQFKEMPFSLKTTINIKTNSQSNYIFIIYNLLNNFNNLNEIL